MATKEREIGSSLEGAHAEVDTTPHLALLTPMGFVGLCVHGKLGLEEAAHRSFLGDRDLE